MPADRGRIAGGRAGLRERCRDGTRRRPGSPATRICPQQARDYLEFLEASVGVEIGCISTGPERDQTILKSGSKLAELLGDRTRMEIELY